MVNIHVKSIFDTKWAFCETDSKFPHPLQNAQFSSNIRKTHLHQLIVLAFESLVGLPVHAFGLASFPIQDASLPFQPLANLVSFGLNELAKLVRGEFSLFFALHPLAIKLSIKQTVL